MCRAKIQEWETFRCIRQLLSVTKSSSSTANGAAALDGKTFDKKNPYTGGVASHVAAGKREDARRAIDAAAAAFPAWSATPPAVRRSLFLKAADVLERRMPEIAKITAEETGQTFGWGMFNCIFAVSILREGAAQAYGLDRPGDSDRLAGHDRHGHSPAGRRGRRHRAVECAYDSRHARRRAAHRLRQYGRSQSVGGISGHAPRDRIRFRGGRFSQGRDQRHHERSAPTPPKSSTN